MEEDIKILEEFINYKNINNSPYHLIAISHERLCEAIENLIARNKELEEENKKMKANNLLKLNKEINKNIQVAYGGKRYNTEGIVIENYLPKSKVKEIKEKILFTLKKGENVPIWKITIIDKFLQELLD